MAKSIGVAAATTAATTAGVIASTASTACTAALRTILEAKPLCNRACHESSRGGDQTFEHAVEPVDCGPEMRLCNVGHDGIVLRGMRPQQGKAHGHGTWDMEV